MTCIVGLKDENTIWIGADSAGTADYDQTIRTDPKVFRTGDYLIGATSSFRMIGLLRFSLVVPTQNPDHTDEQHMNTTFIMAVRQCLKDGGYAKIENSREEGGQFLVGYRGELYAVGSDFQVGIATIGYQAIGCGAPYALGSLYETAGRKPQKRVLRALKAAAMFSAGVARPFVVNSIYSRKEST